MRKKTDDRRLTGGPTGELGLFIDDHSRTMFTRAETVAHIPIGDSSHVLRTHERRKRHQLQNAMKSSITILKKRVILVHIQTCIRHIPDMFV